MTHDHSATRVACFSVHAAVDPGAMPRVLEVFAKESLTPTRWTSVVEGDQLVMDIQMAGLAEDRTDYFARVLGRMPMVNVVLTSAKSVLPVEAVARRVSILDHIQRCNAHDLTAYKPFLIAGERVGWVSDAVMDVLDGIDGFEVDSHSPLQSRRVWPPSQTAAGALAEGSIALLEAGLIRGLRNELYGVKNRWTDPCPCGRRSGCSHRIRADILRRSCEWLGAERCQ